MENSMKNQFIVSDDQYSGNIDVLAKRVLVYGKITEKEQFIFLDKSLSGNNMIKLALVIKFIANAYNNKIPVFIRPTELTDATGQRTEAIGSILSNLVKKEGFAKKISRGQYVVCDHKIESFLNLLESDKINQSKKVINVGKKRKKSIVQKDALWGCGADIQTLIDDGFLNEGKTIKQIVEELKRRVISHNPKVIDKTIRETFVKSRNSLDRQKNDSGGKSKWKYIIKNN